MSLTNFKLYTIVFIDSLCWAFMPPIMAVHMFSLGANHTIMGVLGGLHTIAQLFSGPLIHSWEVLFGKKTTLLLSTFVYFLTYYYLSAAACCSMFIILRVCFAVTNQTPSICKSIAQKEQVDTMMNIAGVAGLILGPIIGGYYFDYFDFTYVTLIAATLLALSFCISLTLNLPTEDSPEATLTEKINDDVLSFIEVLRNLNFKQHRNLILLKTLYATSLTIFFIKFSLALRLNQGSSFTLIGLTYAYQSLVTFLSTFVINYFKPNLDRNSLLQYLLVLGVTLSIMSNTKVYGLYLGSYIAMAVAHGFLASLFSELFARNKIGEAEDALMKFVSIFIPVVFGVACDCYGMAAFNAFVILPIFCDVLIVYMFIEDMKGDTKQ